MNKRILIFSLIILQILLSFRVSSLAKAPENYLKGRFYTSVKNHFLIATEKMNDERFKKTVIAILENDESGSWGLVINKLVGYVPIAILINPSLSTPKEREELFKVNIPIFWGGPVEEKKIFILHSTDYQNKNTKNFGTISITADSNILFDIAQKKGPKKSLIILGYSGWGEGQLEGEMERDHWILSDIDIEIIFKKDPMKKWPEALKNSFIPL